MQLSVFSICIVLGNSWTFASPLPLEKVNAVRVLRLSERQNFDRICGGKDAYSSSGQASAFGYAKSYEVTGTVATAPNDGIKYPHEFRNSEDINLPDCVGVPEPYQEFPILANGLLFADGANHGTDRIIYKIMATDPASGLPENFQYCGVITHIGAKGNKFVTCANA